MSEIIERFCNEMGYDFINDYSGRGMGGRTCVGIVCCEAHTEVLMRLVEYIVTDETYTGDNIVDEIGVPRTDSLGMDTILYFPYVSVE